MISLIKEHSISCILKQNNFMSPYKYLTMALLLSFGFSCSSDDNSNNNSIDNSADPVAKTAIPDPVFEQYLIDNSIDDVLDGEVTTASLASVVTVILDDLNITNLSGIEDFVNLDNLWLQNTNLTNLNVSSNVLLKFLYFDNNNISNIDVSRLNSLEKLSFINNNVQSINVSSNPNLQILEISGNNILNLDISSNGELFTLKTSNNPLTCIQVSPEQLNNIPINWETDIDDEYALDCD